MSSGLLLEHAAPLTANAAAAALTRAIRIAGLFANPNNLLRPGQYGRVRTSVQTRTGALLVPQRAVSEIQGSYQVAVVGSDNGVDQLRAEFRRLMREVRDANTESDQA